MILASARLTLFRVAGGLGSWVAVAAFLSLLSTRVGPVAIAQEAKATERVYNHPQTEVEKALEDLQAYETARLPVLAGFVKARANTLKDYNNPHYQFQIEVLSQGSDHTLVQVKAKITAWYAGTADSTRFQYALIPSNGRLEEELLDRLSIYLEQGRKQDSSDLVPMPPTAPVGPSSGFRPPSETRDLVPSAPASGPSSALGETAVPSRILKSIKPATLASEIAAAQSELEQVERKKRQAQQQVVDLETVARSRQHTTDFAITKRAETPVFERPSLLSAILFHADAEDEFEVIGEREGWVQVRLENAGQAWLPISELADPRNPDVSGGFGAKNFSAANEVIQTFTGEWSVLKGKSALFVWAQPRSAIPGDILGKSQLDFAGYTFLEGYRAAAHSQQTIAGVVVVFTGDKPGVAAATLLEIRRWQEGRISDKLFFQRCSLDPANSFHDAPKR